MTQIAPTSHSNPIQREIKLSFNSYDISKYNKVGQRNY